MTKPAGYPLPWCDQLDMPWWQVSLLMIRILPGWVEWQAHKAMDQIIPVLRWLLSGMIAVDEAQVA